MPVEILMPELGEGVHEGTVSRWLKKEGDLVQEDEPVVEIMTDKVNTELQAPASGRLVKILIPEGDVVEVFHAMGLIEESSDAGASTPAPSKTPEPPKAEPVPVAAAAEPALPEAKIAPGLDGERRWYTPVVRAIAAEKRVSNAELAAIPGTGEGGRVTKRDLQAYIVKRDAGVVTPVADPKAPTNAPRLEPLPPVVASGPEQEIVPLVGMRKMIADAMVRSSQVPTVSTLAEVDVTNMVRFRERNKDTFQQQYGVKLTYTPFFIKAITEALQEFPLLNSSLQSDNTILKNYAVHMGVAVSLGAKGDEGLIVPVIRDCHRKTLIQLAEELENIAGRARSNSLTVADVQGGTFTLTNPGSYGAILGTPMINAPQAAILGTYAIKKVPAIIDDMIAIRSVMNLVLTYDHRIIDGLLAGRFLQSVKAKLEGFEFFK
ncbi:MAG TPA: dihydrolipoamide acetyltransferase family protein [Fimbriimonadaceae bacterium]|nr:dihydrolipoamide acetyltransferase family protein [Fimbriimonadaceae bacterium]HRJ95965.1 dihydrolipoamide acetyltransferase family protein [Fimbriimonadaceae bacterium]